MFDIFISLEKGRENCLFIHVTLVPWLSGTEEHKSKPTQHSVKELQSLGIAPNIIVCRVDHPLEQSIKDRLPLQGSTYEHKYGLDDVVYHELGLENPTPKIEEWVDTIKGLL